jgi:hypothetical protein
VVVELKASLWIHRQHNPLFLLFQEVSSLSETKTTRELYNSIIGAYQTNRDKRQGAKDALMLFEDSIDAVEEARAALSDIDNLVDVLRESLNIIPKNGAKVQVRRGAIVSKLIPCGKHCNGCPHGPYLYKVSRRNGKVKWKYLGSAKKSQPETEVITA